MTFSQRPSFQCKANKIIELNFTVALCERERKDSPFPSQSLHTSISKESLIYVLHMKGILSPFSRTHRISVFVVITLYCIKPLYKVFRTEPKVLYELVYPSVTHNLIHKLTNSLTFSIYHPK